MEDKNNITVREQINYSALNCFIFNKTLCQLCQMLKKIDLEMYMCNTRKMIKVKRMIIKEISMSD